MSSAAALSVKGRWRAAVLRDARVSNATKVLLLVMCDYMREDGRVSVPRSKLADVLAVNPARVTERVAQAVDSGLLAVVERGRPGTTATYRAMLTGAETTTGKRPNKVPRPHHAHGRYTGPTEGPPSAPTGHAQHGPPFGHPTEPAQLTVVTSATHNNTADLNGQIQALAPRRKPIEIIKDLKAADIYSPAKWVATVPAETARTTARKGFLIRESASSHYDVSLIADGGTPYDREDTGGWDV